MRAFVLTAPGECAVQEVPAPVAARARWSSTSSGSGCAAPTSSSSPARWPTCTRGTPRYPMRLGHEWAGTVAAVGDGVDPAWIGRRVMGDTMLGDGTCRRCRRGHQHVCEHRQEVGIRGGRPGALAEQLAVPATSLHALPDARRPRPRRAGRAGRQRAARGAGRRPAARRPGAGARARARSACWSRCSRRAAGAEVHLLGRPTSRSTSPARLGFEHAWTEDTLPDLPFDAVVDASNAAAPARPGAGPGRAGRPRRLHRTGRQPQPHRHPHARAQGRHRGRDPVRLTRPGRHHRRRTPAARSTRARWSRRPSASTRSAPCWPAAARGRRARTQDPRRPATPLSGPDHRARQPRCGSG